MPFDQEHGKRKDFVMLVKYAEQIWGMPLSKDGEDVAGDGPQEVLQLLHGGQLEQARSILIDF